MLKMLNQLNRNEEILFLFFKFENDLKDDVGKVGEARLLAVVVEMVKKNKEHRWSCCLKLKTDLKIRKGDMPGLLMDKILKNGLNSTGKVCSIKRNLQLSIQSRTLFKDFGEKRRKLDVVGNRFKFVLVFFFRIKFKYNTDYGKKKCKDCETKCREKPSVFYFGFGRFKSFGLLRRNGKHWFCFDHLFAYSFIHLAIHSIRLFSRAQF
mmetsp:Transcript_1773/g.2709  ORF Transcript_1773/g.2709 Transcript_1773/m.2709 type:complete len:208 (-) Transcript_1773:232-855(-)